MKRRPHLSHWICKHQLPSVQVYNWMVSVVTDPRELDEFKKHNEGGSWALASFKKVILDLVDQPSLSHRDLYYATRATFELLGDDREAWAGIKQQVTEALEARGMESNEGLVSHLPYLMRALALLLTRDPASDPFLRTSFENFMETEFKKLGLLAKVEMLSDFQDCRYFSETYAPVMEATTASAMSEIREMGSDQLGRLIGKMADFVERAQMKKLLPAFERRLFDVRADIRDMRILSTFGQVFAEYRYESDQFWEFMTDIVASNFSGLSWPEKVEVMRAFSRAKRGSNELWQYFIENSLQETGIDELERNIALTSFVAEIELPPEYLRTDKLDSAHLADQVQKFLDSRPEAMISSANCEDLAYLILFHPWTSNEDAQILENALRNSFEYISVPSMRKIVTMYEKVKKNQALKTKGIDDFIHQSN